MHRSRDGGHFMCKLRKYVRRLLHENRVYELKSAKFSAARPTENLLSKLKRAVKVGGRRLQRAGWLVGRVRSYLL